MKKLGDRYEFNPDEKPVKIIHDNDTKRIRVYWEIKKFSKTGRVQ